MKKVPLALRDDGFSWLYEIEPPCTPEVIWEKCVDFLSSDDIQIKEVGIGAGEARNYGTKYGDILGEDNVMWKIPQEFIKKIEENCDTVEGVTAVYNEFKKTEFGQKSWLRIGDFRAMANIRYLIKRGTDAFRVQCERAHGKGMKVWARQEMRTALPNRFRGRADLVIPNTNRWTFAKEEMRAYQIEILVEAVERGADGVSLDFCVYPPYLAEPQNEYGCITQFFRDLRSRLRKDFDKKIDVIVRLPYKPEQYGLMWKDWVDESLVDVIIPSVILPGEMFDVPIGEYVSYVKGKECKVFGCIRPKFTNIDPDPQAGDEEKGIFRLNRGVTEENERARAALLLSAGADGLEIAIGSAKRYNPDIPLGAAADSDQWKPRYAKLNNLENIQEKDKTYPLVNNSIFSVVLNSGESVVSPFRIADKISEVSNKVTTFVCPIVRALKEGETLKVSLNGNEITLDSKTLVGNMEEPTTFDHKRGCKADTVHFGKDWWTKGRKSIQVPPTYFREWDNEITFTYYGNDPLEIVDVDVDVLYGEK